MTASSSRQIPCARAVHKFDSQAEHELSFAAGVSIMLLRRIDENWLEGTIDGRVGIFPANHVKIELGSPSVYHENQLARSGKPYAIALHPFIGDHHGDLSFNKGDLVELTGSVGSGWLRGRIKDSEGIFPGSFVKVLKEQEEPLVNGDLESDSEQDPAPKPRPRNHISAPNLQDHRGSGIYEEIDSHPATPLRSAPAPPDKRAPVPTKFMTMPKPKPRKLTRHGSISEADQRLKTLESDLEIETKLLESAQNLLQINHSQLKMEKLQSTVSAHQNNIEKLQSQIKALQEERGNSESLEPLPQDTPPPLPPPRPAPPSQAIQQQRLKVINELIHTERDFQHQVQLCVAIVIPPLKQISEINIELLFGNLEEVALLSKEFLSALEAASTGDHLIGEVFVNFAPRLRDTYGVYCRNHDGAAAILEKYMESPVLAEKIRQCMDELRGRIQAWDLQSFLIKPVQRILKYPLLVDKMLENTLDKHPDRKASQTAQEAISQVARDINEIKRRKDIVDRYTGSTDRARGTLSKHSIQKKLNRMQQVFTQFTGLRSKTIDPKFDEIESKVLSLESTLRMLVKDISSWLEELLHVSESRDCLKEAMGLYVTEVTSLKSFETILTELKHELRVHTQYVKDFVISPLENLISLFQDPLHLIHKRKDKLLDYDHTQYTYEHAEEADKLKQLREACLLAKRNYEALNSQLLEELPHFLEISVHMLQHQLAVFVQAQYMFHADVSKLLYPFCKEIETTSEIHAKHAAEISAIAQELTKLSLVPASLAMNFTMKTVIPKRPSESSVESVMSPGEFLSIMSSPRTQEGEAMDHNEEDEDLPKGTQLEVLYGFDAQDGDAELTVAAGDRVTLVCPHDRIGCREWWLVEREDGLSGYVPATYLDTPTS